MTDIQLANHGSIFIFTGLTPAGQGWIEDHLVGPDHEQIMFWDGGIVVGHQYVDAIIDGAINDGLEVA